MGKMQIMINRLYDSSGNYRGFLDGENIYNSNGKFVGFLDINGDVYTSSGNFIGAIVDGCVVEDVLRSKVPKGARIMPAREPTVAVPRGPIMLGCRYKDGFDKLEQEI
jgi:hypothetical protein